MKKRVLSFLLLVAMLVTMIPVMASGAAAETSTKDVPRSEVGDPVKISSYYELYKTDGLVAFFDALDPNNGTLDLANGKWYARVYNAETRQFEVSDTVYATIEGGVYDAETNKTGWKAYASGFGYADPDYTPNANVIELNKELLYNLNSVTKDAYTSWAVDTLIRVDLRDLATVTDNKDVVDGAFLFGSVSATHATNAQTGDAGKVTWTVLPAKDKAAATVATNSTSFVSNNGVAASLLVAKVAVTKRNLKYVVTHGGVSESSAIVTNGDYPEDGFHVLKNEQGAIYALRVYGSDTKNEALTVKEAAANATVDALITLDVSLDVFNTLVELGGDATEKFLSEIAPAELIGADKAQYEARIVQAVADEKELRQIKLLNEYERLYVGADGKETANGGKLVALFNASGKGVDLENGVWINKIGDINATFGNHEIGGWTKRADGGVGYTGIYGQFDESGKLTATSTASNIAKDKNSVYLKTRLNFGLDLLPDEDFTIEYVAKYTPIYVGDPAADDKLARDAYGTPIQFYTSNKNQGIGSAQYTVPLDYIGVISSWTVNRDGQYSGQMPTRGDVIWMITDGTPSWGYGTAWVGSKAFTGGGGLLAQGIREYDTVHTYVYTRDENPRRNEMNEKVVDATYTILRDSVMFATQSLSTENREAADTNYDGVPSEGEDWGKVYYENDTAGDFYLSSSIPTDFYAVRIYDGVLTTEQLAYNAFIDMAAYAKANLSDFNSLDSDTQKRVANAMVGLGFTSDPLKFEANFLKVKDLYANRVKSEGTLYVQDGLRVLTTAYEGLDTGSLVSTGISISWFNAVREGELVTLKGAEWTRRANSQGAGYYILKEYSQMQTASARSFGIYLTEDMLPAGDYTIEMVVNPTGIIEYQEDGSYERYIDRSTTYGIHYENGFMIGPLRCLIFPSASDGGSQRAALEKRWCYDRGNECWNNTSSRNHKTTESAWRQTALNDIVSYVIDYQLDKLTGKGEYSIYNDQVKVASISIKPEDLISNADANNAFQLMVGMPCGVFSIRVYERMLSEAEKLQNHAADIIYHYCLDTSLLDKVMPIFKDDPTVIYRGLSGLSFDMTKEEAQKEFDASLAALWLSFDGVSVRNDYTEGLRYYFTVDATTATAMVTVGYQIEIGAIANVGQESAPTLDGHNYDYRIKAYDGVAGINPGFYIDKNTFAVTVKAGNSNKESMLTQLKVLGYIRLVAPTGEETVFYINTVGDGYDPDSFFSIYNYMMEREDLISDAPLMDHLYLITEGCYEREYVHLMAGAADGGNGTQETPYNDFATAFAAAKKRLLEINVPTYLYVYASEGVYEIHELLTIDGSEIPYTHARFVISSADSKGTLTTTRKLDSSAFIESENNIWVYQFGADASGAYPNIRYIYVNGKIADIAHNGANNFLIADETRYMTRFYRWDNGPWLNAKAEWEAGRLKPDTLFYPIEKVDLNTRFAHYRDQYLVYEELAGYSTANLLPTVLTTVTNPSSYYVSHFEEVKFNKIAYNEITALYYGAGGEDLEKTGTLLDTYVSKYAEDSVNATYNAAKAEYDAAVAVYNIALEAYNAAVAAYEAAMETYVEGTEEYAAAVAAKTTADATFADAQATYDAATATYNKATDLYNTLSTTEAKAIITRYLDVLTAAKAKVAPLLKAKKALAVALADYALTNPTNKYPVASAVVDTENPYKWPAAPSTGIFATVTSLYTAGLLTHESTCVVGDKNLAQELQFNYYRDAYLALADVNALVASDTLTLDAVAPDAESSAQYKSLFKQYLYTTIAVKELEKIAYDSALISPVNNTVTSWKIAPVAVATTSYADAPAEYVKIFTEVRDTQVRAADVSSFSACLPMVKEADGPYQGTVPYSTGIDDYKMYLNIELVGDQSFAMAQGRAKLAATAQSLIDTAVAAYKEAYNKLADLQKRYEDLVDEGRANDAKTLNDQVVAARTAARTAYDNYVAQCKEASRYNSAEYDEAFILAGSGIQLSVPTEWTYNVVSLMGVDYADYVMYNGEKHVAMYCDPNNPFSIHNENHVKNRMVSLSSSHAYLDKNNEYYYNCETGTLYYYNTAGIDGLTFEYPTMNNMFYLTNLKNVYFEDIAFTGIDYNTMNAGFTGGQASSDTNINCVGEKDIMPSGAALYGSMIRGITVRNCNFHDLGCEGISFRGRVENTVLEGNSFTNIGSGAIRFGGGSASTAIWSEKEGTENCTITNNYLDGIAIYIYCSPAITTQFSKDLECSYNTILNCSYSGYSIGWSWSWASFMYGEGIKLMHVDIHHNYIASHMQQMGDGGAIYTLGGNAVKEEHTLFNWCHDNYLMMTNTTGDGEGRFAAANYHDGSSSNWLTYNTVVAAYSFGAAYAKDAYGHTAKEEETMTTAMFETIDTPFTMEEYVRRIRNNYNRYWAYYEQTLDSAQAFNITLRDNFLINVRLKKSGTKQGTSFYEAYRNGVTAEDFIFVENMTYVYSDELGRIPRKAEDIIYDAGCEWAKGDPYDLAGNNY